MDNDPDSVEIDDAIDLVNLTKNEKKDIEKKGQTSMVQYWWTIGFIELARDNFEEAVINFKKVAQVSQYFDAIYLLGRAYLKAGSLGEAVAEFEKAISRFDDHRAESPIYSVKVYYLLGLAYEKSGWKNKAIEQYEEFLDIWKDADPGIDEVEDAKERLKKLKGKI